MYALHQIAGIRWLNESNSNSYIFYERVNFEKRKRKLNEEQNGLVTVNNRERAAVKDDNDDDDVGDSDAFP